MDSHDQETQQLNSHIRANRSGTFCQSNRDGNVPITADDKIMNDSGPPSSLWDEAQPVNIIVDYIRRQTINLSLIITTMTNCVAFFYGIEN